MSKNKTASKSSTLATIATEAPLAAAVVGLTILGAGVGLGALLWRRVR